MTDIKREKALRAMGILGIVSLISYTAAVLFAPLAYPGYQWMRQAVSDLSANNAPSRTLWNQLASLYNLCGSAALLMICVYVQGKLTRTLRTGLYAFTLMQWISAVGYAMFPLTDSGYAGTFQDGMHLAVTAAVVMLSIASLVTLMAGGYRRRAYVSLAVWATVALGLMCLGAVGMNLVPKDLFGVTERCSVFAATGFTAVLGVYLLQGFRGFRANPALDKARDQG
ncbi:MAG TPA: DUF998 domain-containing protein [Candidatus Limiplasma sp.]|nr:DUF998 domain-containing protein [Candidatus Limiplasma sp.]HPS82589.1 DUF998 domain-containing protein [Candidatus Limiplasma sp.]